MRVGGALHVTVCCARATQTASSPILTQDGLRARWSPAATGWGVRLTDCLRCRQSGGVLCRARAHSAPWHIADTHICNIPGAMRGARAGIFLVRGHASRPRRGCPHIPGPCVTPAQECNAHTGDARMCVPGAAPGATDAHAGEAHIWGPIELPGATTPTPATVTRDNAGGSYARTGESQTPGTTTPAPAEVLFVTSMRGKMQGQCKKCGSRQHFVARGL